MFAGERTAESQFDIPTRTLKLLLEIEKHDALQWKIYNYVRDDKSIREKTSNTILMECDSLHQELNATIHASDKIVADIISLRLNPSNDIFTQIFLAAKEILDRLLLNQEQQLVNYQKHMDIRKDLPSFCRNLEINITMTNKMIVDLRTMVCWSPL